MSLFMVLGVLAVLAVIILILLTYSGFFYTYTIRCTIPASLPKRIAYKVYRGAYWKSGNAASTLSSLAPNRRTFSVFYDDPDTVDRDATRYIVGCYLSDKENKAEEDKLTSEGYSIWTFPTCSKALVTEFPYRTFLSLIIGPWRVYPSLKEYIKDNEVKNAGPFVEICNADYIQYVVVLDNNDGFYPPEVANQPDPTAESKKDL